MMVYTVFWEAIVYNQIQLKLFTSHLALQQLWFN